MRTLEQIRNRLKEAITLSGLSQSEIARRIGVRPSSINQYLSGRAMPALDTFGNLCEILDVSSDYVLCIEDAGGARITENTPPKAEQKPDLVRLPVAARSKGNTARNITLELTQEQLEQLISEIKGK